MKTRATRAFQSSLRDERCFDPSHPALKGRAKFTSTLRVGYLNDKLRFVSGSSDPYMTAHINDLFNLSDRVAIVTGGSRGLGKEMAEGLAEAGASLMLCARREEWLTPTIQEFRAKGFTTEGMLCDVTNQEQVQKLIDRTIDA